MKRIKYWIVSTSATFLITAFSWFSSRPVIYMAGDSTMANKAIADNPERGLGQLLPEFLTMSQKLKIMP